MLDTYDFCSNDLKKQLDGPRVAVREEEDRKANKDRAAKKAKMVSKIDCIKIKINRTRSQHVMTASASASAVAFLVGIWLLPSLVSHMQLLLVDFMLLDMVVLQEESDAQYKNKGKKGSKADAKGTADAASKADAAPTTAPGTGTTAPTTDADKDVEMVDAPGASSSGKKKHVGELTGESASLCPEDVLAIVITIL